MKDSSRWMAAFVLLVLLVALSVSGAPAVSSTPPASHTPRAFLPVLAKAYDAFYADEFNSATLGGQWQWVNQDPSKWSLSARPGFMRLTTHAGTITAKNLLLQKTPAGDFWIETRLLFTPTGDYQMAGILLYQDANNYLLLGRGFCSTDPPLCVGNGIYFYQKKGGVLSENDFATPTASPDEAYLRVARLGNAYLGYYSEDGSTWTVVGSHDATGMNLSRVGLAAGWDYTGTTMAADFDYVRFGFTPDKRGMSYASWWHGQYSSPDGDLSLAQVPEIGANWVSVIATQYQDNVASTTIGPQEGTPTDSDVAHAIRTAHSLGLNVMLKLHLNLYDDPEHWHGEIGQAFTTDTQWQDWFASYTTFIVHYADLARSEGVDLLCVGAELLGTAHRESEWRGVVSAVRAHYPGPLVYGENWGAETFVTWWDAVDFIGVSAYYELADNDSPTLADLRAAWQPIVNTLSALSATWGKKILFTEIGYTSLDGTAQYPYAYGFDAPIDLQEQADCYEAMLQSVWNQPWFGGVFWWNWLTDPFAGGPCDEDYTPHDKPAEDVLRAWYGVPPRPEPAPDPQPNYAVTMPIYTDARASGWDDWSWNAAINFGATDQVYSGTKSIRVTLDPWAGLSLWHYEWDPGPYHYLEFYVRSAGPEQAHLTTWFEDPNDVPRRQRPADDCRYTDGGTLDVGMWKRVRIPLTDLDANYGPLERFSLQNWSDETVTVRVDEIHLVGALQQRGGGP